MPSTNAIDDALDFVSNAELPAHRPSDRGADDGTAAIALASGKAQATVVGADVLAFATGVDSPWRQDFVNSTLLAQLVANKQVPDKTQLFDWYDAYFNTLQQIGWGVTDRSFAVYVEQGQSFQAHEAILKVATVLLGPGATALALVTTTLDALKSMSSDSPWLTLFDRESQTASAARFQIGVVEQASNGELSISLMAFGLEAKTTMTQVLFFKSLASQATLRHSSGKIVVDTAVITAVRDSLKAKLVTHATDFVRTLPDL